MIGKRKMSGLDYWLGKYKWYRRWRGGKWWMCAGRREYSGLVLWVNEKPPYVVNVVYSEDWD